MGETSLRVFIYIEGITNTWPQRTWGKRSSLKRTVLCNLCVPPVWREGNICHSTHVWVIRISTGLQLENMQAGVWLLLKTKNELMNESNTWLHEAAYILSLSRGNTGECFPWADMGHVTKNECEVSFSQWDFPEGETGPSRNFWGLQEELSNWP